MIHTSAKGYSDSKILAWDSPAPEVVSAGKVSPVEESGSTNQRPVLTTDRVLIMIMRQSHASNPAIRGNRRYRRHEHGVGHDANIPYKRSQL